MLGSRADISSQAGPRQAAISAPMHLPLSISKGLHWHFALGVLLLSATRHKIQVEVAELWVLQSALVLLLARALVENPSSSKGAQF